MQRRNGVGKGRFRFGEHGSAGSGAEDEGLGKRGRKGSEMPTAQKDNSPEGRGAEGETGQDPARAQEQGAGLGPRVGRWGRGTCKGGAVS